MTFLIFSLFLPVFRYSAGSTRGSTACVPQGKHQHTIRHQQTQCRHAIPFVSVSSLGKSSHDPTLRNTVHDISPRFICFNLALLPLRMTACHITFCIICSGKKNPCFAKRHTKTTVKLRIQRDLPFPFIRGLEICQIHVTRGETLSAKRILI